jgi:hypothetical protein
MVLLMPPLTFTDRKDRVSKDRKVALAKDMTFPSPIAVGANCKLLSVRI